MVPVEIAEVGNLMSMGNVGQTLTGHSNRASGEKRTPPRTDVRRFSNALPMLDDNKRRV